VTATVRGLVFNLVAGRGRGRRTLRLVPDRVASRNASGVVLK
jgi:hypothetical protein